MSVVSASRISGRGGDASADVREHEEVWEVICSSDEDTQEEILASGQIPGGYSSLPADPAARASRYRFQQDNDDPRYWVVRITYSTRQPAPGVDPSGGTLAGPGGSPQAHYTDDPRTKPAQVSFRTEPVQVAIQRDLDGYLICDSTGRPYATQTIEDNGVVLSITKNRATLPISLFRNYRNAVNQDNFFGIAAGMLKMLSIRAESNFDKETFYWAVSCDIFIADEEWIERYGHLDYLTILDRGPEYVTGGTYDEDRGYRTGGTRHRFTAQGQLVEGNLDGAGLQADAGDEEVYREFRVKPRRPFSALGIYP